MLLNSDTENSYISLTPSNTCHLPGSTSPCGLPPSLQVVNPLGVDGDGGELGKGGHQMSNVLRDGE